MSRTNRLALKIGLPVIILLAAAGITAQLIASREDPDRDEAEAESSLVETETVHRSEHRLDIRASGTVIPARQVTVQPEVNGRVVEVHPQLTPGGLIEKGDKLVQIDRSDYKLAVDQRKTALKQAKAQLEIEKGQQQVARREWKLFQEEAEKLADKDQLQDPSLALRKPQLMNAKAQVEAAESQLESAQLNLRRTSVQAPFDAIVRQESVAVGQLAGAQSQLATLVGTEYFWIRLSIGTDKIEFLDIPGVNADTGSAATVRHEVGDKTLSHEARVVRLLGDLDPAGRMARVLVEIEDPLDLDTTDEPPDQPRGVPLLLDAYVDVSIEGNQTRDLIELPRRAVRNGDEVYLVDNGKLAIETLDIVWRRPDSVLVDAGLTDGDTVVVGPLPSPVEGMRLEPVDNSNSDDVPPDSDTTSDDSEDPQ